MKTILHVSDGKNHALVSRSLIRNKYFDIIIYNTFELRAKTFNEHFNRIKSLKDTEIKNLQVEDLNSYIEEKKLQLSKRNY